MNLYSADYNLNHLLGFALEVLHGDHPETPISLN